jgi:hypothetical protein
MIRQHHIPITEIGEHTDRITVGSLALPEDFDPSRLGLNVRAVEHALQWGGIGPLTYNVGLGAGRTVKHEQIAVGAAAPGGTISSVWTDVTQKPPLQRTMLGTVSYDSAPLGESMHYARPAMVVNVNATERDALIADKPKRWPDGIEDPEAQAKILNKALQSGLAEGVRERQLVFLKKFCSGMYVGSLSLALAACDSAAGRERVLESAAVLLAGVSLMDASRVKVLKRRSPLERQWSLFADAIPLDRYLIAHQYIGRRLIKALP